jgi:hypothetical protein
VGRRQRLYEGVLVAKLITQKVQFTLDFSIVYRFLLRDGSQMLPKVRHLSFDPAEPREHNSGSRRSVNYFAGRGSGENSKGEQQN